MLKKYINTCTATATAAAFALSACKKTNDADVTPSNTDSADQTIPAAAPAEEKPTPAATPKPAPSPTPKPDPVPIPAATDGSVSKLLNGYWAPNFEGMIAAMKAEAAKSGEELPEFALQMVEIMVGKMVLHMDNGKATMLTPDGSEPGTYKVISSNDATGAFVFALDTGDGTPKTATGKVEGDKLTMTVDDQTLVMDRIDKAEYAKRQAAIESPDSQDALKGMIEGALKEVVPPPTPPTP